MVRIKTGCSTEVLSLQQDVQRMRLCSAGHKAVNKILGLS
ncbi:hypothetical protein KKC1_12250 [Calderihabitans maritimus]|uniref:Uncharacterized protein n=1 Tax=Calderihabitans maritimus TaxID=1246530 RepID=A0A1Z5HRW8_9FIRM|nr:hypothetical protein KKC1_12250 [Calderihabitans maritimus]